MINCDCCKKEFNERERMPDRLNNLCSLKCSYTMMDRLMAEMVGSPPLICDCCKKEFEATKRMAIRVNILCSVDCMDIMVDRMVAEAMAYDEKQADPSQFQST